MQINSFCSTDNQMIRKDTKSEAEYFVPLKAEVQ